MCPSSQHWLIYFILAEWIGVFSKHAEPWHYALLEAKQKTRINFKDASLETAV
jgi:hypothetical protein